MLHDSLSYSGRQECRQQKLRAANLPNMPRRNMLRHYCILFIARVTHTPLQIQRTFVPLPRQRAAMSELLGTERAVASNYHCGPAAMVLLPRTHPHQQRPSHSLRLPLLLQVGTSHPATGLGYGAAAC